jgi:hypothetical protein
MAKGRVTKCKMEANSEGRICEVELKESEKMVEVSVQFLPKDAGQIKVCRHLHSMA